MTSKDIYNYVPDAHGEIQVNCCKNPQCANFGIPHLTEQEMAGRKKAPHGAKYRTSGSGRAKVIHCKICHENIPVKNNQAIAEELSRFESYLDTPIDGACQNKNCENKYFGIDNYPSLYRKFGTTGNNRQRYQCKKCKKTISLTPKASRQQYAYKNRNIFKLLMNYVPFRRILEIADINFKTLYDKIDYIEGRCQAFLQYKECEFFFNHTLERLYIGSDQQFFTLNWTNTFEKRNVILRAIASCDNKYRYCFGMHLNYDPNVDVKNAEIDSGTTRDYLRPPAYRNYSRIWLERDYWEALQASYKRAKSQRKQLIESQVREKYLEALEREDIEAPQDAFEDCQLPHRGAQVHSEYTLHGHFFLLRRLFTNVEKVRFFLDQDSGMRAACIGAFFDRIQNRTCDAFYISTDSEVSIHERKKINQRSSELIAETMKEQGFATEYQARRYLLSRAIEEAAPIGKWQDEWVKFPYSHAGELKKMVCYLTNYNDYDFEHIVNLFDMASIHSTDNYFQLTRRRIRLIERPLKTMASSNQWNGYSAYNPKITQQLLNIFRAYYNYCLPGQDGKTPAMRIGMAKKIIDPKIILYFGSY